MEILDTPNTILFFYQYFNRMKHPAKIRVFRPFSNFQSPDIEMDLYFSYIKPQHCFRSHFYFKYASLQIVDVIRPRVLRFESLFPHLSYKVVSNSLPYTSVHWYSNHCSHS